MWGPTTYVHTKLNRNACQKAVCWLWCLLHRCQTLKLLKKFWHRLQIKCHETKTWFLLPTWTVLLSNSPNTVNCNIIRNITCAESIVSWIQYFTGMTLVSWVLQNKDICSCILNIHSNCNSTFSMQKLSTAHLPLLQPNVGFRWNTALVLTVCRIWRHKCSRINVLLVAKPTEMRMAISLKAT